MTGRNHHVAVFGGIADSPTGHDGDTAVILRRTGMVAEVLKQNDYATACIGKKHNAPSREISPRSLFNNWPTAWGFDYFHGVVDSQTSQ